MGQIYANANARIKQAYAEGSRRSYYNKFTIFLTFCQLFKININDVSVNNAIAFIEVLAASSLTSSTIMTYVSAIKAKCVEFNLNGLSWSHHKVALMIRSCSRTAMYNPPTKQVLSPLNLTQLVHHVSTTPQGPLFKALFLLAFHGFFRISNLLPTAQSAFQPLRNLTRGDVTIASPGISVLLKWTKTLQASRDRRHIPLAAIPGSILCPLQAVLDMHHLYPVPNTAPMFSYMSHGKVIIITQTQARKVLSMALTSIGLNPSNYGFHTFRRSGASLAFSLNIPIQYIKAQGTWQSDAVWQYLDEKSYPTILTTTMAQFLSTT